MDPAMAGGAPPPGMDQAAAGAPPPPEPAAPPPPEPAAPPPPPPEPAPPPAGVDLETIRNVIREEMGGGAGGKGGKGKAKPGDEMALRNQKLLMNLHRSLNIPLPYIVSVEEGTKKVLSVRRNWREGDVAYQKRDYFTHYKFIPGLGFYGLGYAHGDKDDERYEAVTAEDIRAAARRYLVPESAVVSIIRGRSAAKTS